jgi:hypothetical protein
MLLTEGYLLCLKLGRRRNCGNSSAFSEGTVLHIGRDGASVNDRGHVLLRGQLTALHSGYFMYHWV